VEASRSRATLAVLSQFTVANGLTPEVKKAFQERPRLVDQAPGFVAMEVLSPRERPDEIWLMTWWEDEQSFKEWHRSEAFYESRKGIPAGLKLQPRSAKITYFSRVSG
jgi:heme oxygenase (mycobilin-producing)